MKNIVKFGLYALVCTIGLYATGCATQLPSYTPRNSYSIAQRVEQKTPQYHKKKKIEISQRHQ